MALLATYMAVLSAYLALDLPWLMLVAADLFRDRAGNVLRADPQLAPALAFYGIYAFGLMHLAVRPALLARSGHQAVRSGAVLGLTAYATFDLTNLAVIRGWTWDLALFDIGWGVFASSMAALLGYRFASRRYPASDRS